VLFSRKLPTVWQVVQIDKELQLRQPGIVLQGLQIGVESEM
jgi:hypothetical protein